MDGDDSPLADSSDSSVPLGVSKDTVSPAKMTKEQVPRATRLLLPIAKDTYCSGS